jgi:alanine-glyoxylate transaminase / serine-glyoxylate transaminase / serine-pyruvate transaminase
VLILNEADKQLMIPGPTPVQREILASLAEPTISHGSDAMAEIVARCLQILKHVAGAGNAQAFVFSGAGTLSQEVAVINLLRPGDRLLVASNGWFGDRFIPIAEAHGIEVDVLQAEWGESVTAARLTQALARRPAHAVTLTHVETSTGVLAPLAELTAAARQAGAYVIVDSVAGMGGVAVDMDEIGIDILLTGAQKALGVPPGLCILLASERAMERRRSLGRISAYYADLLNWEETMADAHAYFSTHSVNLFYGLQAGLEIIDREGLDKRFARHQRLADGLRAGMAELGMSPLTSRQYLAPTLSVVAYPDGVDDAAFRNAMSTGGVVVAPCLGSFKGRGVRVGHMGNIGQGEILRTVEVAGEALAAVGGENRSSQGVGAAQEAMAGVPQPAGVY